MLPVTSPVISSTDATAIRSVPSTAHEQAVPHQDTGTDRIVSTCFQSPIPERARDCLNSFLTQAERCRLNSVNKSWVDLSQYHTRKKLNEQLAQPHESGFRLVRPIARRQEVVNLLLDYTSGNTKKRVAAGDGNQQSTEVPDAESRETLEKPHIQRMINAFVVTEEEVLKFNFAQIDRLGHPALTWLICEQLLNIDFALQLTPAQVNRLSHPCVQKYLYRRFLGVTDALWLDNLQMQNLASVGVQLYLDKNMITLSEFLRLNSFGRINLEHPKTQYVIDTGQYTIAEILRHSENFIIQYAPFYKTLDGKVGYLPRE